MLHRPHTAADATFLPTAVDAMLQLTAVDAMLQLTAADATLDRQGSARRPQATVAAPPREVCVEPAVAAALTVGARVAAILHAAAAQPGTATTMEGCVAAH